MTDTKKPHRGRGHCGRLQKPENCKEFIIGDKKMCFSGGERGLGIVLEKWAEHREGIIFRGKRKLESQRKPNSCFLLLDSAGLLDSWTRDTQSMPYNFNYYIHVLLYMILFTSRQGK